MQDQASPNKDVLGCQCNWQSVQHYSEYPDTYQFHHHVLMIVHTQLVSKTNSDTDSSSVFVILPVAHQVRKQ